MERTDGKKRKRLKAFVAALLLTIPILSWLMLPDTVRILEGETIGSTCGIFEIDVDPSENQTYEVVRSVRGPNEAIELSYPGTGQARATGTLRLFGILPVKNIDIEVWEQTDLIVCGDIIGIDISTNGVMILGTGKIDTQAGAVQSPAKGRVYSGDLIHAIDGKKVESISEVREQLEHLTGEPVTLSLERAGRETDVSLEPVPDAEGQYRLGLWIRDREQGLGTLTYVNPENGDFGAIGHGITDVDTREILSVGSGFITTVSVLKIVRGEAGQPGEIQGAIGHRTLGIIEGNTENGVYGVMQGTQVQKRDVLRCPIALKDAVKEGPAEIYCSLDGETAESYAVEITKKSSVFSGEDSFIVTIVDPDLLEKTGGIVQGMSGSPIVQNGRLIGAVTHVLVKDPTRGYGLYIENMLEEAREAKKKNES